MVFTRAPLGNVRIELAKHMQSVYFSTGQVFIDMTCGGGGHTRKILETVPNVKIYGLDRDPVAFERGVRLQFEYPDSFFPMLGKFSELPSLVKSQEIPEVDGVLFDLGCSSMQFEDPRRGFGLSQDGPLDMRMDGNRFPDQPTAAEIIAHIDEERLARILKYYGEEKKAKKIARAIVEARYLFKGLKTTNELASLIESALDNETRLDKLSRPTHAATKTFQAIRIFVNNEMNELNRGIEVAYEILKPGGKLVVLTFHSLEDRIVKRHLTGIDMDEPVSRTISQKYRNAASWHEPMDIDSIFDRKWNVVTKHVVAPSFNDTLINPRCRSAKLRCATKNVEVVK
ncbi:unnamed protein product [Orchesella dallaii]|uniref:Methyltransferase-like protein 15 n=1 Tax=Orchesella dallaii TaxID=48710 RepID=A0ABP1QV02_9HEXA